MRISLKKDDPGYQENANKYRVMFDGIERLDCFTADEELGEIHCYVIKASKVTGERMRLLDNNTREYATVIEYGKVEIIKPKILI